MEALTASECVPFAIEADALDLDACVVLAIHLDAAKCACLLGHPAPECRAAPLWPWWRSAILSAKSLAEVERRGL